MRRRTGLRSTVATVAVVLTAGCAMNRVVEVDRRALETMEDDRTVAVRRDDGAVFDARVRAVTPQELPSAERYQPGVWFTELDSMDDALAHWDAEGTWDSAELHVEVRDPVHMLVTLGGTVGVGLLGGHLGAGAGDCRPNCVEDGAAISMFFGALGGATIGSLIGALLTSGLYNLADDATYRYEPNPPPIGF